MEKNQAIRDLEKLIDCNIVGVVHSTDGENYYGLKIDNRTMEEGYILWLVPDPIGNFIIENFDSAEEFEEI